MTEFALQPSAFLPVAVGFFGLGTGYFIWGGQELFGWPKETPAVAKSMGMWGFWMPGFMQLLTGTYLWIGLTWLQVFKGAPLYMAALAFTAYGVHWFALGHRRFVQSDSTPDAWMALAFTLISILGAIVFFGAGDAPVGLLFVGLTLIYISDALWKFGAVSSPKLIGFFHCVTGVWLMYLMYAITLNVSLGAHWWV